MSDRHSYVRFFPSDWLGGTARMTRMHKSVYFDICCYQWDKAQPCPASELPLMLGDLSNWRAIVEDLIAAGKLERGNDDSLSNPRAATEAQWSFDQWERKSRGGRAGAEKTNTGSAGGSAAKTPAHSPAGTPAGSGHRVPAQNQNQNQNQNLRPDLKAIHDEVGFTLSPNDTKLLQDWYSIGATLDQDILPTIRAVMGWARERPRSLKFFDAQLRTKLENDEREIERLGNVARRYAESSSNE